MNQRDNRKLPYTKHIQFGNFYCPFLFFEYFCIHNHQRRGMKYFQIIVLTFVLISCGKHTIGSSSDNETTATVQSCYKQGRALFDEEEADSAIAILLVAADEVDQCPDRQLRMNYHGLMAEIYEQKNLFELQERSLRKKLDAAKNLGNLFQMADTHFALGVSCYTQDKQSEAKQHLRQAYELAAPDSADFRARCMLMLGQVFLQTEENDSVRQALEKAKKEWPEIAHDELYHLTEVYMLSNMNERQQAEEKIREYLQTDTDYTRVELLRLAMEIHERSNQTIQALHDAQQLITLTDSLSEQEASQSTAKIHQLKHEEKMKLAAAEQQALKAAARSRLYLMLALLTFVVATATVAIIIFRRRTIAARQAEIEALRLAEAAQNNETVVMAQNEELQRRYYEHLYAILLPILNAKRTSSGHIDLNEKSWRLIEENTELVLPNFAHKLRRNHPTLTDEDIRFCCLVAMRVPNPVIANIYAIASSSVGTRYE